MRLRASNHAARRVRGSLRLRDLVAAAFLSAMMPRPLRILPGYGGQGKPAQRFCPVGFYPLGFSPLGFYP